MQLVKRSTRLGMVLVLLLAAVLRLWMLPAFPLGLHYDEAANVILTRQIAQGDYRPIFIRPYTGKEVLFFYASAPWIKLTGGQAWGMRLSAAMLGILTVSVTYAMARELLGQERNPLLALFAAAWMAVAFPHIVLSRYGFRAITLPLLQGLAVTAIWRGLRTKKTAWLIAGGLLTGLTGYTYLAARLFPLPLAASMGVLWLQTPKEKRTQRLPSLMLILICAVISFAPLGLFFLRNPGTFGTRIAQVAAPSITDAVQGLWACIKALALPGQGDPYVRFNIPGRPIMDGLTALLACIGLVVFVRTKCDSLLSCTGRVLVLASIAVMLLPSALATAEITPSNLRLAGVFPFLMLLPALGLSWLTETLPGKRLRGIATTVLFLILGALSGRAYALWSSSTALFYAADGEMVLTAHAVDDAVGEGTTVFVSSEHYKHPTIAALSPQFSQVKWITGGSSFILPSAGDVVRIVPQSVQPPSPWPETVTRHIRESWLYAPDGSPSAVLQHLAEDDIATIKQHELLVHSTELSADFAHITGIYELTPLEDCESGQFCTISLVWEVLSPYTALQPMVRINHPVTGEWARAMPFHYPAEQWTPGDIVLDQIRLDIPASMPPGEGYQLAVSMVDSESQNLLPRLLQEQFAGLEYSFAASTDGPWPAPPHSPLTPIQMDKACGGIPRDQPLDLEKLRLLGWLLPSKSAIDEETQVNPGELLLVSLCWEVLQDASTYHQVTLLLRTADAEIVLHTGAPAGGYRFAAWLPGTFVEDRYALRIPREMEAGPAVLQVHINDGDDAEIIDLAKLEVMPVTRTFSRPEAEVTIDAEFGSAIRLLGYDLDMQSSGEAVEITLYWQSIKTIDEDYVAFIHLVEPTSGEIITQVDEQPLYGEYPTSMWAAGEVIADMHSLRIPSSLPDGRYTMRTGLYIPLTGTYLTVNGTRELTFEIALP